MSKKKFIFLPVFTLLFSCSSSEIPEQKGEESSTEKKAEIKTVTFKSGEMMLKKTYHPNGQLRTQGNMLLEKKEGKWVSFYENGMPWSETWFEKGKKHGSTTVWYASGRKFYEGRFEHDKEAGKWIYWDEQGNVLKEFKY